MGAFGGSLSDCVCVDEHALEYWYSLLCLEATAELIRASAPRCANNFSIMFQSVKHQNRLIVGRTGHDIPVTRYAAFFARGVVRAMHRSRRWEGLTGLDERTAGSLIPNTLEQMKNDDDFQLTGNMSGQRAKGVEETSPSRFGSLSSFFCFSGVS